MGLFFSKKTPWVSLFCFYCVLKRGVFRSDIIDVIQFFVQKPVESWRNLRIFPFFVAEEFHITPPKINIEPENDGLEDDFPFPGVYSQVPC